MDVKQARVRVSSEITGRFDEWFELSDYYSLPNFLDSVSKQYDDTITFIDFENIPDTLININKISTDLWSLLDSDYGDDLANYISLYGQTSVKQAEFDLTEQIQNLFASYLGENSVLQQELIELLRDGNYENSNDLNGLSSFYLSEFMEYLSENIGIQFSEDFDSNFDSLYTAMDDAIGVWWYYIEDEYINGDDDDDWEND